MKISCRYTVISMARKFISRLLDMNEIIDSYPRHTQIDICVPISENCSCAVFEIAVYGDQIFSWYHSTISLLHSTTTSRTKAKINGTGIPNAFITLAVAHSHDSHIHMHKSIERDSENNDIYMVYRNHSFNISNAPPLLFKHSFRLASLTPPLLFHRTAYIVKREL